jgi:predicted transglutaminase-like cysteine proteinase
VGDDVSSRSLFLVSGALATLCLASTAAIASPKASAVMTLGASALPPRAYVDFCERQPWDCGANPRQVLARAAQADAERAQLLAMVVPPMADVTDQSAPAALGGAHLDHPASGLRAIDPTLAATPGPSAAAPAAIVGPAAPSEGSVARADAAPQGPEFGLADGEQNPAAAPLPLTPQLWTLLNRTNAKVNRAIVQRSDQWTYGKADYWSTPIEDGVRYGDCEDFVLEKVRALQEAGVPREALNVALVTTAWGESHAVLVVSTADADLVLDSLSPWIAPWNETGYQFREREVGGDPFTWAMVESPRR